MVVRNGLRGTGFLFLLAASQAGAAETTKINGVTDSNAGTVAPPVSAKDLLPPDQALRIKKIFLFPSIDDLSGALVPKLDEKLASLFSKNTRFELIRDPQVVKALSPDENSYPKAAVNQSVHREAARVVGADTTVLLRTRNVGSTTQMNLELRDARGSLLYMEEGSIPGNSTMDARWGLIEKLYRSMLSNLPFEGTITGRTANTLTVDLGMGSVKQGEEIEIARIVSVQRHPLLGTIVGTDYVRTGRAKVGTVDRVLSFAEVVEENQGERITAGQKVLLSRAKIVRRANKEEETEAPVGRLGRPAAAEKPAEDEPLDEALKGEFDKPKPRYGLVGGNLYYGSLSHTQTVSGALGEYSGSGLGGDLNGELWITKNWILSGTYSFQGAKLTGPAGNIGSSRWHDFSMMGGYRIFPESLAEGVTLTGSVGYQTMNFDIPADSTSTVGGKRYAGLFFRADAEIAFLEKQTISVGFGIQPFSTLTESGPSLGTTNGGSAIGLHLGWNKQLLDNIWLRIGMRYAVANGSYENSSTVSNKRFAIGPGLYYLF
jgi:hypothetical protein